MIPSLHVMARKHSHVMVCHMSDCVVVTTFPFSLPRLDTGPTPEPRTTAETVIYDR